MAGPETRFLDGFALGMWQANCYLLGDLELGACVVIDPGQGGEEAVTKRLAERGVRCEAILLTHGHLDHLWSAPALAEHLDVEVLLHGDDRYLWDDPGAAFGNLPPGALQQQFGLNWVPSNERLRAFRDGERLVFSGASLEARHTPGHTPGSSVFLLRDGLGGDPLLLSGDLIFAGSVGRTDFPRGSWDQLIASVERVVLPLPDGTRIASGHGPETTVGTERTTNPFVPR
ncbi:MAG: MBL fold metallo-hydrolase [Nitriliruptorales bacterium]|nr:MBL fold metallo-hydrolase [Nitriliruptorales bacterium]